MYRPSESKYTAGTSLYLNAYPNSGYRFKCWMEDGIVISTSSWFYYTMPAKNVEIQAVFVFEPDSPANPDVIPLTYKVTVEASPSRGGNVYCGSNEVGVGNYTYVRASSYSGYQFRGWILDGKLVSDDTYYYFNMEARDMHFTALFEFDPSSPDNPNSNPNNGEVTYLLIYTVDGEVCHVEDLPVGAPITPILEPTKEGYIFSGWSDIPALMPERNVVISGTFIANRRHVTYKVEDCIIHEEDVECGATLTPPTGDGREGYTLKWENLPSVMPDADIVVEGYYAVNVYKLTYKINGEVYKEVAVTYADPITPEGSPTKEGHTFGGWSEVPATMPAQDIVVTGHFTVNKYLVTFKIDGKVLESKYVEYGTKIVCPKAPEREGYVFSGWNNVQSFMPARDMTINGTYSVKKYLVSFKIGGEMIASEYLEYGEKILIPEVPEREGYTFGGWGYIPETMPACDITIVGSYIVNKYLVSFKIGGEMIASEYLEYGERILIPEVPEREGYTFGGWENLPDFVPACDMVIAGSYIVNKYLVAFVIDGDVFASDTLEYGANIVLPEVPEREGYTFGGWENLPDSVPACDMVIVGSYIVNKYLVTFVIDGDVFVSDTLEYGANIVLPEVPEREGYTFGGWENLPDSVPACDTVIAGSYVANKYLVTFKVDGEEIYSDSLAYGTAIVAPEAPEKEGYTFNGWGEVAETVPASAVTYEGTYIVNKYLVIFKVGDEVISSEELEYGSAIVAPEAPEKEGYTFDGWCDVDATVPAEDVTYEGTYTVNTYRVFYYVDEELVYIAEVAYGAEIPEYIYEPEVEDDVFIGWVGNAYETMPAHDVSYTANIENGIDLLRTDNGQMIIYNLNGFRVLDIENIKGGIYIVNGRKVLSK